MRNVPGAPRDATRAVFNMDGGGTTRIGSSSTAPWSGAQPAISQGLAQAQTLFGQAPPAYFPGAGFVPFSPQTEAGLGAAEARATAGSPLMGPMRDLATKTLSGDFLGSGNPYFSGMMDKVSADLIPRMDQKFAGAGYGGPAHQRAVADALSDTGGALAFQNYGQERSAMQQLMGQVPQLAEADYLDPSHLLSIGASREGKGEQELQDQMKRYDFNRDAGWNQLARYMALINGGNFGTNTNSTVTENRGTSVGDVAGGLFGLGSLGLGAAKLFGK